MKRNVVIVLLISLFCLNLSSQTKVIFYTTKGDIVVELREDLVPITAGNFIDLVKEKYYDGVIFHRVIDNFMIQGGKGAAGKPNIQDEFHDSLSNLMGTISMANTGAANSGNTQFFINLKDNTGLDYNKAPLTSKHPVFGKVVENFNVVQDIGKVATNGNPPAGANKPLTDVVMDSLRIVPVGPPAAVQAVQQKETLLMTCSPNPINENSIISFGALRENTKVKLIDIVGNEVAQIDVAPNQRVTRLPFSELSDKSITSGIYLLQMQSASAVEVLRIVVR